MRGAYIGGKDIYYQSHILIDELSKRMDFIDINKHSEDEIWKWLKDGEFDYAFIDYNPIKFKKSLKELGINIITHYRMTI